MGIYCVPVQKSGSRGKEPRTDLFSLKPTVVCVALCSSPRGRASPKLNSQLQVIIFSHIQSRDTQQIGVILFANITGFNFYQHISYLIVVISTILVFRLPCSHVTLNSTLSFKTTNNQDYFRIIEILLQFFIHIFELVFIFIFVFILFLFLSILVCYFDFI